MARIYFSDSLNRQSYFDKVKEVSKLSWNQIARECKISTRHLTDLRRGKYSLSHLKADLIKEKFGVSLPDGVAFRKDNWHVLWAGKLGGQRHFELYGLPPVTKASRRKGGFNSRKAHKLLENGFIFAKTIIRVPRNAKLAEIIGVFMGDGGLTRSQACITLNYKTDKQYAYISI